MVKALQLLVATALALLAIPLETSAGVAAPRAAQNSIVATDLFGSDDSSSSSESHEEERSRPMPESTVLDEVREDDQSQAEAPADPSPKDAQDAVEDDEGLPGLPPSPVIADKDDSEQEVKMAPVPEQPWESSYKHGVAPARLPAWESDNAHGYRHSIIHPYGDDVHA